MASLCSLVTLIVASVGVISTETEAVEPVLQCYQCNSTHHPDCSQLLHQSSVALLKPCPQVLGQQPFCRKIHQTIHSRDGLLVVIRKCGWERHEAGDCYRIRNLDHAETVCQCFTDGCNSAPPHSGAGLLLLLTLGVTAVSFK